MNELKKKELPQNIGIIMDGNRRWARQNGLVDIEGHTKGVNTLEKIALYCNKIGIRNLVVYAFSVDNWKREKKEVRALLDLIQKSLSNVGALKENNIKIRIIGNRTILPKPLLKKIDHAEQETGECTGLVLSIAFNYSGKEEIVEAFDSIYHDKKIKQVTKKEIEARIYTNYLEEIDVLIRTGGEKRNSGFLLWKAAYAEIFYVEKYWPDFEEKDLNDILIQYKLRERKMGK